MLRQKVLCSYAIKQWGTLILTASDTEAVLCIMCLKLGGIKKYILNQLSHSQICINHFNYQYLSSEDSSQCALNRLSEVRWKMGWTSIPGQAGNISSPIIMSCAKNKMKLHPPSLYCSRETLSSTSQFKKLKRSKKGALYDNGGTECCRKCVKLSTGHQKNEAGVTTI